MCSRGKTFSTLGFLHAPTAHGEAPVFLNYVIQRALQQGVLPAVPRHVRERVAREESEEEGYMGEDEEDTPGGMGEEKVGKRKRRKRGMGGRPAQLQKGALPLMERRQVNHKEAQRLRDELQAGQGEHEEGAGLNRRGKRAARSGGQGGSGKRGRR